MTLCEAERDAFARAPWHSANQTGATRVVGPRSVRRVIASVSLGPYPNPRVVSPLAVDV